VSMWGEELLQRACHQNVTDVRSFWIHGDYEIETPIPTHTFVTPRGTVLPKRVESQNALRDFPLTDSPVGFTMTP
jgi:hypothetical protein